MTGIGAEKICAHRRAVRGHHDEIGLDGRGLFENLVINAALPHYAGDAGGIDTAVAGDCSEFGLR